MNWSCLASTSNYILLQTLKLEEMEKKAGNAESQVTFIKQEHTLHIIIFSWVPSVLIPIISNPPCLQVGDLARRLLLLEDNAVKSEERLGQSVTSLGRASTTADRGSKAQQDIAATCAKKVDSGQFSQFNIYVQCTF